MMGLVDKSTDRLGLTLYRKTENERGNNSVRAHRPARSFSTTQSYLQCRGVMDEPLEIPRS
jgi:hypothetical protein